MKKFHADGTYQLAGRGTVYCGVAPTEFERATSLAAHAVAGQVEREVRPTLAEALDAWWGTAYAEGREGRTHDTEDGAAQKALRDIWAAHSAQIAAAVAKEHEHAQTLRKALQEADTIMGHEDEHTAWRRRRWAASSSGLR
jgi:hypothetical protein